jgi:hypothetical protein
VRLRFGAIAPESITGAGVLLAANLLSRLYPEIDLDGSEAMAKAVRERILVINPGCAISTDASQDAISLAFENNASPDEQTVTVAARGWNVYVDRDPGRGAAPAAPTALAAACLGVAEVFRIVFADELGTRGRRGPQPGTLNLVTLDDAELDLPVPESVAIPRVRLVGAGAIGQAAALTLSAAGLEGTIVAIDPERVALSNLQRYVLTEDADVDRVKVDLLGERIRGANLTVKPQPRAWDAELARDPFPTLTALDTREDRIAVQASLPGPIYNAFTQPADIGWSRHEVFGDEPCLACLYWPDEERPGRHEQIASAFKVHPLRVLAYLLHRLPVGLPLPPGGAPELPGVEPPAELPTWLARPLLQDIAAGAGVGEDELAAWRECTLADLYQDGICGGALLHLNVGEVPQEVVVPLAHQSALAGVMLATELIVASVPDLSTARPPAPEARFNVLSGFPQVVTRPRELTVGCICSDSVYRQVYREKFASSGGKP